MNRQPYIERKITLFKSCIKKLIKIQSSIKGYLFRKKNIKSKQKSLNVGLKFDKNLSFKVKFLFNYRRKLNKNQKI